MKIFVNNFAVFNCLGNYAKNPELLERFPMDGDDLFYDVYKSILSAINNLYAKDVVDITPTLIDEYLSNYPISYKHYLDGGGREIVAKSMERCSADAFELYYEKVKKLSLLQSLSAIVDIDAMYNPDTVSDEQKTRQEEWLDESSLESIMSDVDKMINEVRETHFTLANSTTVELGEGADELIDELMLTPDVGFPSAVGGQLDAISRGYRKKKYYLFSAGSGIGKTRGMMADAAYNACSEIYDTIKKKWVSTGGQVPTTFIALELDHSEMTTMALAYLSGVPEGKILHGNYQENELERVRYAAKLLKNAPLYLIEAPEFSFEEFEMIIRRSITQHNSQLIFFDYLSTNIRMMEVLAKKTRGIPLAEHQILSMMSTALKTFANRYDVAIVTATQLNGSQSEYTKNVDGSMLAGSKAILNKLDFAAIKLPVFDEDLKKLSSILATDIPEPTHSMVIIKNRRGGGRASRLWYVNDGSTCRIKVLFATDNQYRLMTPEHLNIFISDEDIQKDAPIKDSEVKNESLDEKVEPVSATPAQGSAGLADILDDADLPFDIEPQPAKKTVGFGTPKKTGGFGVKKQFSDIGPVEEF